MIAMKHLIAFEVMSLTKLMITNECPDADLLRSRLHMTTLILFNTSNTDYICFSLHMYSDVIQMALYCLLCAYNSS